MTTEKIHKGEKGYYAHRFFNGKNGVPKISFFLSTKGYWNERKLDNSCYFPTKQLAQSFLKLRKKFEEQWGKAVDLDWKVKMFEMRGSTTEEIQQKVREFLQIA